MLAVVLLLLPAVTHAAAAYPGLSYNLCLVAHNAKSQDGPVPRLKNVQQFYGADHETYVAGAEHRKPGVQGDAYNKGRAGARSVRALEARQQVQIWEEETSGTRRSPIRQIEEGCLCAGHL